MLSLFFIGSQIAAKRKALGLSQSALALNARISRATLDALENGRSGEIGYSKIVRLMSALGLALTMHEASSRRPTLDELLEEDRNDQSLDRGR